MGGPPCQSFSIAGARQGVLDPRGACLFTLLDVVRRYRPRWLVLENVPGLLSSDGGRDFGTFLGALAKCGYGFAYRILDAQYFGLPQRRRRLFLIGHARDWRLATQVLFERDCLCGPVAPGHQTPPTAVTGASAASHRQPSPVRAATLKVTTPQAISPDPFIVTLRRAPHGCVCARLDNALAPTLCASEGSHRAYVLDAAAPGPRRVRRLTPREYERLQGFPDDYTQVPYRGQRAADTPRYHALGNSMAVPVMRWLGERIAQVEAASPPTHPSFPFHQHPRRLS